jgi:hypothetical protein
MNKGNSMKWLVTCLVLAVTPIASSATVAKSPSLLAAEPILLTSSAFITVYNLNHFKTPSLFWSGVGIAVGTLTLVLSTADAAAIPVADAVLGAMSILVGLARFPRAEVGRSPGHATGFHVGWRSARFTVRF